MRERGVGEEGWRELKGKPFLVALALSTSAKVRLVVIVFLLSTIFFWCGAPAN